MTDIRDKKWWISYVFGCVCFMIQGVAFASSTVNFDRTVHFLSPNGDNVQVGPGKFEVDIAEEWLQLIPSGSDRAQAVLVHAAIAEFDGLLSSTQVLSEQGGADQHILTLILPDGLKLVAEGTYSGVRSRGRLSPKMMTQRRPRSLVSRLQKRPRILTRFQRKASVPQITRVTGPHDNFVQQLLARVNCQSFRSIRVSARQCERVKADLRRRLKGYRVIGTGTPRQRVSLYTNARCLGAFDFRRRIAQEVTSSVRSRLGSKYGTFASRILSLLNQHWPRVSNVVVPTSRRFSSVFIAPKNTEQVTIATPAGKGCSRGFRLPRPTPPVVVLDPDPTPPSESTTPPETTPPSETTETTPTESSPPSSNGTAMAFNPSEFLNAHNAVRANVVPPASPSIPPFSWNTDVANVAQNWANQCNLQHNAQRGALGENLFVWSGTPNDAPQRAVNAWAAESSNYEYASNTCPGGVCGHYTQVVWEQSVALGCGMTQCQSIEHFSNSPGVLAVCNYSPQGNFGGQRPYRSVQVTETPSDPEGNPNDPSSPDFPTVPLTGNLQEDFLAQHNVVRANVVPSPATPIPPFTWNPAVASVAQEWANQCVFSHNAQRGPLGENLYLSIGPSTPVIQQAVEARIDVSQTHPCGR